MLATEFLECELWKENEEAKSWKYIEISPSRIEIQNPNGWPSPDRITNQKLSQILKIIRNSLAHGNVYILKEYEISNIRFVTFEFRYDENCRQKEPINVRYIDVSPDDFRLFTNNWVKFLKTNIENIENVYEGFAEAERGLHSLD